ncbi:MAG: NADH-quinone oxidoreductase subunit C [Nitrospirae bacterium CG18_big_fil_WC_8_21_14_2_50_70_55]|nr:NADH-quinone oxidoreductase subunit C [Deltaproteobacteria bacterium]OIP61812.1 MAG: NADH dehydrogenase [Nitrospirae bacterium CG2_30_70_394]PIQ04187.1 MAG: NADH-quinone oxidoreductase subunit C [Nitrospirae bacterium CG18_big_fil_WC_8_21_14_2_50_70_55]PIU79795.1 MAG: NADH-quinone oxidoreductase subunit C [Nitrospirae bacterium CG06_land_8_20_14_3_00_70_43]PIW82623.1 MAG: NADH-quinone oxidoreductase subunit C [Nitrospirae bacterium CG_4_8_14_3_um_filter_70_85]PIX83862.1 MAG: NADH-quinone ox
MAETVACLRERFPAAILETHAFRGDDTVVIGPEALRAVATFLHDDLDHGFEILMDVTAVDYLRRKPRFEVVYHFLSHRRRERLRLKVPVDGKSPVVPSLCDLWPSANWYEREVWDMYGVRFEGHPDLRRILMYDEFVGFPLRKDYRVDKRQPLVGPVN